MRKKRILAVSESPLLSTGYGRYTENLLKKLHDTGKYDITLLASYCDSRDGRLSQFPWYTIGNNPLNPEEEKIYNSHPQHQLGSFRFEQVAVQTMPDIVFDFRDQWYFDYQENSILRSNYGWVISPTVDAAPQKQQWIYTFSQADKVLTYTDWGAETLKEAGLTNVVGTAQLGVDYDIFAPVKDKAAVRRFYGLDPSAFIVGMVSRNQPRKLYPDLLYAFSKFIKNASADLSKKTYLLLHTSFPEQNGFDIPRLLKNLGITNKVLFSYFCHQCHTASIRNWQEPKTYCDKCNALSVRLPDNRIGVSQLQLSNIYNLMDLYVQYANSEGIGIGQLEAAACGVPVMSVDYSGMHDVVQKLNGYPIKYHKLTCDYTMMCMRAVPDDDDFIRQLNKFLTLPADMRRKKGEETRKLARDYYTWDKCAAMWDKAFDQIPIRPIEKTWGRPPQIHTPKMNPPANMSPKQFVRWAIVNVWGQPKYLGTYIEMKMCYDLTNDLISPELIAEQFQQICLNNNKVEEARYKSYQEKTKT